MGAILLLGGTGTVGTLLTGELSRRGLDFVLGARDMTRVRELEALGFAACEADFRRPETLDAAMRGVDGLFLLTPLCPAISAWTIAAIRAAKSAAVQYVVRLSGAGAGVDSGFELGRLHGALDEAVRDSGLGYTLLRPALFMQNFAGPWADMVRAGALHLPFGDAPFAMVDVRDVARAGAEALADPAEHSRRVYTLTGPQPLTLAEAAKCLERGTGRPVAAQPVDDDAFCAALCAQGTPDWTAAMLRTLAVHVRQGDAAHQTRIVERVTGRPPVSFDEFVQDYRDTWL